MAKRKRNYTAEYKRRIERGKLLGYSKAIARGHPRTTTETVRDQKTGKKRKIRHVKEVGLRGAKFLGIKPGTEIDALVRADAEDVFGRKKKPRRRKGGTDDTAAHYQLRLAQMARRNGMFDWVNENTFIQAMMALGLTERDAYTHWFSP